MKEFEEYLERYCKQHGLSKGDAMALGVVREVEKYYRDNNSSYNEEK